MANWQFQKPWNTHSLKLYQTSLRTLCSSTHTQTISIFHRVSAHTTYKVARDHCNRALLIACLMSQSTAQHYLQGVCHTMCTTVTKQSTLSADCNSRYNLKSLTYTACQILLPLFFWQLLVRCCNIVADKQQIGFLFKVRSMLIEDSCCKKHCTCRPP